jgi:hypothetical protein
LDAESRDRLTRLETEMRLSHEYRNRELAELKEAVDQLVAQQQVITNRMLKFDGGFWIIMTISGIIGFLVANFKHYFMGKVG